MNSVCLLKCKMGENVKEGEGLIGSSRFRFFRVGRLDFSVDFRQIRPLEVFGARRKAALRGEVYA